MSDFKLELMGGKYNISFNSSREDEIGMGELCEFVYEIDAETGEIIARSSVNKSNPDQNMSCKADNSQKQLIMKSQGGISRSVIFLVAVRKVCKMVDIRFISVHNKE